MEYSIAPCAVQRHESLHKALTSHPQQLKPVAERPVESQATPAPIARDVEREAMLPKKKREGGGSVTCVGEIVEKGKGL